MRDVEKQLMDMRYLTWTKSRKSSGTAGSFLKAYDDIGERKKYYKLSDYDPIQGIIGHECVNEIIVQRLMDLLGIEHLSYRLIHAMVSIEDQEYETYLCESEDFKEKGESKIPLEDYYAIEKRDGQTPLDFCMERGWADYIYQMLVIDYLVLNRDRHGANIEVLRSPKKKSIRLAPLFDHGLSLVCRCHNIDELERFDVMEDKRVQAFIGSGSIYNRSTYENVRLVPREFLSSLPQLKEEDRSILFEDLEGILPAEYFEKIWDMIWRRWLSLGNL
ncbi:MAG: hypothetical protein II627_06035 [Lachnospiraceae bacterium]|nr:hypothetical protein [Lachnospiraceae bacterium]